MNLRAFTAMLARDGRVARRNLIAILLQTFLQPLFFTFIFGRVMVSGGYMPQQYKSLLLPGIMAICMFASGIWAVTMPLILEFQYSREIEDRLLAPMKIEYVALEKVVSGALQALASGFVVIPLALLLLRPGVNINVQQPVVFAIIALLAALFAATAGLVLGCSVSQANTGLMFSMVVTPLVFFGCTYYPWSALSSFPILQKIVLINPLVYASEGLRGTLVPQFPHISHLGVIAGLSISDAVLFAVGLRQFRKKAVS